MTWLIYGANGYSGRLLAELARSRGHRPLLAGRREGPVHAVAADLGLEARVVALGDRAGIESLLSEVHAVVHCAGPFSRTAAAMLDACLATGTHYVDISGEIDVLEQVLARHQAARSAGVALLPASGFDVVPTDCLAAMVTDRLPGAVRLDIAFLAGGGLSPGTARTAVAGMAQGGRARLGGVLMRVPSGWQQRTVEFPSGPQRVTSIPWGDVSTAYHSTGVPDIVTYTRAPADGRPSRLQRLAGPASRLPGVTAALEALVSRRVTGPDESRRRGSTSQVWARAETADGRAVTGTMTAPNAYSLTADSCLRVVERVLAGAVDPGAWTPSQAHGSGFVLELDGVTLHRFQEEPG